MSMIVLKLPWSYGGNGLIYGQCTEHDNDEAPCVADVIIDRERSAFGITTDQEVVTAAFIVSACNAHEQLVEALKAIVLRSTGQIDDETRHGALFDCHCLAANALAALNGGAA